MLRARREEDKEARRRVFLDAVRTLFARQSFDGVTMADVAKEAGLAKGTVFLYFPTKEALFLAVAEEEANGWLDEVDKALGAQRKMSPEDIARMLADSLTRRPALTRMLTLVSRVLENLEPTRVQQFKLDMFLRLRKTGQLLERHLGWKANAGVRMLLRVYALIVGLRILAEPGPVAQAAMQHPELFPYLTDFNREMNTILLALLRA